MCYPVIDLKATGDKIKELRIANKMSIKDVCIYMGFENPQSIYKWERGECLPTIDNLFALSELFDCRRDDICIKREENN